MPKLVYSQVHIDWLKDNRSNYKCLKHMLEDFNKTFNFNVKYNSFKGLLIRFAPNPRKRGQNFFSDEELLWAKQNYKRFFINEKYFDTNAFINEFKNKFDLALTRFWFRFLFKEKLNIQLPSNRSSKRLEMNDDMYPIGYEKKVGGIWFVKVDNVRKATSDTRKVRRFNYKNKSNLIYEQHFNVTLDDKEIFTIHLDGDYDNFEINNLFPIPRNLAHKFWGKKYSFNHPKLNKIALINILLQENLKEIETKGAVSFE